MVCKASVGFRGVGGFRGLGILLGSVPSSRLGFIEFRRLNCRIHPQRILMSWEYKRSSRFLEVVGPEKLGKHLQILCGPRRLERWSSVLHDDVLRA